MAQKLIQIRDINGYVVNALNGTTPSDLIYGVKLVASAEQHMTAPTGAQVAYISYSPNQDNVFVDTSGATAIVYTGTLGAVTAQLVNPNGMYITFPAGAKISLVSDGTPFVEVQFFTITPGQGLQG
jgi:hypothetical protein